MKTIMKIVTSFFVLLLFVLPCYSQKENTFGWQKARWGMTEKELQDTFKSELKKLPKREVFNKAYADYNIPDYEIEGGKYTVFFQMDEENNKLIQVLVSFNEMESPTTQETLFDELESLLSRKYGTAGYRKDDRTSVFTSLKRQWASSTTTVELNYSWTRITKFSYLAIRYFPTKSGDFDKV